MKAIMYHYVRPHNPDFPFFNNLDIEDFRKQLDYFERTFGFVSKESFLESFTTGKIPKGVVLTFDDGLKCHFDYVYAELKKRNLWGIFYVSTQPYTENKFIDVHRTHVLLGKFGGKVVYEHLKELLREDNIDQTKKSEFEKFTYQTQVNDNYTLMVKRLLNYFISYDHRELLISKLMGKLVPKQQEIFSDFYLTPGEIKQMHDSGMLIGSHTVAHPVMSRLTYNAQKFQIEDSFQYLENTVQHMDTRTFCYPYGGFHSFNQDTEDLLTQNSCLFSFNVEPRDISSNDVLKRPQALPRYDCNQFEFGQVRPY